MKTYQTEQNFVENFSQDVKTENNFSVNGKEFAAEYVGKNSGAQAVYSVEIDGVKKNMNITQLKKRLGVTYTREQNRTGETKTQTRFVEKTEAELMRTASNEYERYRKAFDIVAKFASKYCFAYPVDSDFVLTSFTDAYCVIDPTDNDRESVIRYIMDTYIKEQEQRKAEQAEKAMQAAKEKAAKQAETIKQLLAQGMDKEELIALLGL